MRYNIPKEAWSSLLLYFSFYVLLIEFFYGIVYDDIAYVINSAFFLFNFILSAGVYQVILRKGAFPLKFGVLSAAAIAVASVYFGGVDLRDVANGRSTGTFNNPNQLGYFSVCLLSLAYLLNRHGEIRFLTMLGLLAASLYLAIASLSKAAIISNILVLVFVLHSRSTDRGAAMRAILIAVVIAGFSYLLVSGYFNDFVAFNRVVNWQSEKDSTLESRGYFAFLSRSIFQIIPGIGSFDVNLIVGHEVHSTFASILNAYGVIGFSIFASVFVIWSRTLYRAYGFFGAIALQGPAIFYGISHNGNRFSIFWLLFSASMALATRELSMRASRLAIQYGYGVPPPSRTAVHTFHVSPQARVRR
jgi:hypothetical protein